MRIICLVKPALKKDILQILFSKFLPEAWQVRTENERMFSQSICLRVLGETEGVISSQLY